MYLKPPHLPKACILLLEEDPFLRAGLARLLSDAGYVLAHGADGTPGAGCIDLVLAGFGRDRSARAALPRLDRSAPLILLVDHAAWCGLDFLDLANELGAVAVLPRPFARSALLSLVASTVSQPPRDAAEARDASLPQLMDISVYLSYPNFLQGARNSHPDAE
ncbi:ANTAR domain-containing protein [Dongia sp. agr-C8]